MSFRKKNFRTTIKFIYHQDKNSSMGKILQSKEVKEALKKAKEIERKKLLTKEEIVKTYKEGMTQTSKLKKLLTPSWFVKDVHKKKKNK